MFTSSSAASVLPFSPSASSNAPTAPAASDDQSQSFADVLHQHGGDASNDPADRSSSAPSSTAAKDTPAANLSANPSATSTDSAPSDPGKTADAVAAKPVKDTTGRDAITPKKQQSELPAPAAAATGVKPKTSGLTAGSDLAAMIVQATVLASHAGGPVAPAATIPVKGAAPTTATTAKAGTASTTPDVGTLIAQATALAASTSTTTATATAAATVAKVSTLPGREIPISPFAKSSAPASTKEKKSSAESAERSFIQSGAGSSKDDANPLNLISTAVSSIGYQAGNQSLTTQADSGKNAAKDLAATAAASVGTAHVEKKLTMNELTSPETIATNGTMTASRSSADVNILLSSNHDFEDAIKQVVHIAQLSEATSSRLPNRIAIELQTPPGAIVNVYVSKQNDQYRAQLSTNDPAALSWVQDKITSLRQSNDLGVEVKWLPAQMEASPLSATTASSNDSNLNWNRDGQNPQNYQQPDDRSQSQRQRQTSSYEELDGIEAESFSASFATLGGAA